MNQQRYTRLTAKVHTSYKTQLVNTIKCMTCIHNFHAYEEQYSYMHVATQICHYSQSPKPVHHTEDVAKLKKLVLYFPHIPSAILAQASLSNAGGAHNHHV